MIERRAVEWVARPDPDDDSAPSGEQWIHFRMAGDWFAVDADQLILPITVIDQAGVTVEEPYPAILKQYGGEGLLNDMLLSDQDLEQGSNWEMIRWENRLTIEPLELQDD